MRTSGEHGEAQYHQQNEHLNSQRYENEDHEEGAVGRSELVEVDGPLCSPVAVDCRARVLAVVRQVPELLGDAVARARDRGEVAVVGAAPRQGGRWLPLGRAASLEGVIPVGADGDVNDPGGSCENHGRRGKIHQASKPGLERATVVPSCWCLMAVALVCDLQTTQGGNCWCKPFAWCLRLARFGKSMSRTTSALCYNLFLMFSSPVATTQQLV